MGHRCTIRTNDKPHQGVKQGENGAYAKHKLSIMFGKPVIKGTRITVDAKDDVILSRAYAEERILLTEDKDFGELVFRLHKPAIGIILFRFHPGEETQKATRLQQLLQNTTITLVGAFVVLESDRIRTRSLLV